MQVPRSPRRDGGCSARPPSQCRESSRGARASRAGGEHSLRGRASRGASRPWHSPLRPPAPFYPGIAGVRPAGSIDANPSRPATPERVLQVRTTTQTAGIGQPQVASSNGGTGDGARSEWRDPRFQAYALRWLAFTVAPIAFGLDKFFNVMVDSPCTSLLDQRHRARHGAAVHVLRGRHRDRRWAHGRDQAALRRLRGGRMAGRDLLNLLTYSGYYDIALRDFGLMLGATWGASRPCTTRRCASAAARRGGARTAQRDDGTRGDRAVPRPLQRVMGALLDELSRTPGAARTFPEVEAALGGPGGDRRSSGRLPHASQRVRRAPALRFLGARDSPSGRWGIWMDAGQARAVGRPAADSTRQ